MRAFIAAAVAIALFGTFVAGDLPEFVPCSFHAEFHTRILNEDKEVIAKSIDHVYYDNENYWRWDSDFTGVEPLVEPHQWTIIWRPDMGHSYHDYGSYCLMDDGRQEGPPPPYDWLERNTNGIAWFRMIGKWEGLPVFIQHSKFTVNKFRAEATVDAYMLQEDSSLVLINGTAKNDLVDLTFHMDTVAYEHNVQIDPRLFIPAAHCANGTGPFTVPPDPTADFRRKCYEGAGSYAVMSWVALLLLLVSMLV